MKADLAAPSTLLCHSPPVIIANHDPVFHRNEIEDTQSSGLVGIVEADEPQTSQIYVAPACRRSSPTGTCATRSAATATYSA